MNRAIAKACGIITKDKWGELYHTQEGYVRNCPDYCNDLNAMHKAEKTLPDLNLYRRFLYLVVLEDPTNKGNEPAFATANQRAEAFLRILGLWKPK